MRFVCFVSNRCGDWYLSCNFFFSHSPPIITFNYGDKFIIFFRAVRWRVWRWQKMLSYSFAEKGSVMTILTVWLSMWVVCQLFVCHLIGWVTDLWTAESLASFQTWWLTDWLCFLTGWLTGCNLTACLCKCLCSRDLLERVLLFWPAGTVTQLVWGLLLPVAVLCTWFGCIKLLTTKPKGSYCTLSYITFTCQTAFQHSHSTWG